MDGLIIQKPILFDFGKCHLLICYEFGLLINNYSPDSKIFACTVGFCQELMFGKSCVLYRHIQCPFKKIEASNGLVLTIWRRRARAESRTLVSIAASLPDSFMLSAHPCKRTECLHFYYINKSRKCRRKTNTC